MVKNSILIGLSFLVSKLLGLLRETLLASYFGVSSPNPAFNLDAYFAAFKLPDFVFNIVSSGVISAAFIPLFVEYYSKKSPEQARRFASDSLYLLSFVVAVTSIVLFIGARYFVQMLVPGFSGEILETTINLTRLMLIVPLIFTISSILNGVNNSLNHYKGIALAPIFYNLGIILGIVLWGKTYGVTGVAWGVIIGAVACLLVQLPEALRSGFTLGRFHSLWNEHTKRLITLAFPRIAGMSVTQLSLFVDTFLASLLPIGSLTYINLASNLYFVPVGIVGISIAVTHFSHMSTLALKDDLHDFAKNIRETLQSVLFLLIPITVGMILISKQLVTILFMRGLFTQTNVDVTAQTLQVFCFGIIGTSLVQILARACYALKNTKTPLIVGTQAFTINIIIGYFAAFYLELGTFGLALATSISSTLYSLLLLRYLSRKLNAYPLVPWKEALKYLMATLFMGVGGYVVMDFLTSRETIGLAAELITEVVICASIYAIMVITLKSHEARIWVSKIKDQFIAK